MRRAAWWQKIAVRLLWSRRWKHNNFSVLLWHNPVSHKLFFSTISHCVEKEDKRHEVLMAATELPLSSFSKTYPITKVNHTREHNEKLLIGLWANHVCIVYFLMSIALLSLLLCLVGRARGRQPRVIRVFLTKAKVLICTN